MGISFQERIEKSRTIRQAQIEQDRIIAVAAQTVDGIPKLFHMHNAGGAPVAPLLVLFNLAERLRKKLFVLDIVFYQQKLQGFRVGHTG